MPTSADTVTVFSKPHCGNCVRAKAFLSEHAVQFTETTLDPAHDSYASQRDALVERSQHRTFPFIFVGDTFIGGFNELVAAYDTLKLHELLDKIGVQLEAEF